ncbi:MAG: hypothetical protein IVW54_14375 [Candidatus Binataceae bacterium]|nr:hypothetical protein [Candidatus Binataceae bacterium]
MSRIAAVLIPDFPIAAFIRSNPELREAPVAISASSAAQAELIAVSPKAAEAGVRRAMTATQARAIAGEILIARRSPAAERAALDALIDVAESISPLVEAGAPDRVWLSLDGLARLYDNSRRNHFDDLDRSSPETVEAAIASDLISRARRVGLEVAVGVAANKELAYLAARCGRIRIIAPGKDREFLDWLPIDMLELDWRRLEAILARWGIRRLGDLARLDPRAVASRLGPPGLELIRIARGENTTPLVPRRRAELFSEKIELEYGLETIEPLAFVMRPMLERLVERIALRGLVAGDISLEFGLVNRNREQRRVTVAAPANEVRALLTLMTLSIEHAPPAAAVEAITIAIEPQAPRPAQAGLFTPPAPAPSRLETTIAQLSALCGPDRAGMLKPLDSWRPEAMHLLPFAPPSPRVNAAAQPSPGGNPIRLAIRAIRPAEEVEVMCDRGAPEFVRGKNIAARVVSIAGPWRRDGEWWGGAQRFVRDYYDLALANGCVYRTYCDPRTSRWFIDGIYD